MTATTTLTPIRMRDRVPAQALIEEALRRPDGDHGVAARVRAAQGQRLVAGLLATLPGGWTVLHSLPVADGDAVIDHVVIGPAGVLPVTTVFHPGKRMTVTGRTVLLAGERHPAVVGAEADGDRLGRLLAAHGLAAVPVHPVVAVAGGTRLRVTERPRGVAVLPADVLRARLAAKPATLDAATVDAAVALLDRADLWRDAADAGSDLLQRFTELEARTTARSRFRLR
ncbi:MAG TPA: nuclease-related domain-containing protein [Amnibacterium sp.]|nr:nuclease-related domain-containing protein [Amnibacterium sp.]